MDVNEEVTLFCDLFIFFWGEGVGVRSNVLVGEGGKVARFGVGG